MNYYQRLQVDPKASTEVIKSAYRVLLKRVNLHPDLGGDEAVTKEINEAYGVVSDPAQREVYDRELALVETLFQPVFSPEYILFCHFCGKRNRIYDESRIPRARCGACHRKLQASGPAASGEAPLRAFRLGVFLFEKGLLDRSLREFLSAVRLKPKSATYRYWLGRCYYQKRSHEKALVEFRVAVSMKPKSFQFRFWLGQTYHAMKDHGGAAGSFETAAEIRPDYAPTFHRLGSAYFELQKFDEAVSAFERTLELDPHSIQSLRWLGLCQYSAGDPERAAQAFLQADRMAPGDPFTQKYLGLLGQASA
ncbi:MAG: tetratricopeptide repeat protein [SAR324 cluster bacterium]|nr:tetratricopeptide repeat protein [SAR324 cluster bacterium]